MRTKARRRRSLVRRPLALLLAAAALASTAAVGQTIPDPSYPDLQPELADLVCPVRNRTPADEAERVRWDLRARYTTVLPQFFAKVPAEPDTVLHMPVDGVRVSQVSDTWGAARSEGRIHEGTDIFAPAGTPVRSATSGFVYRMENVSRGGNTITIVGGGGRRYFYTHLSAFAEDLREGQHVTPETVIGYVGNSGNAAGTPPHLHLGVYGGDVTTCAWDAINPYAMLADR